MSLFLMEERTFTKDQPYDELLKQMRKEFLQLWDTRKPSNQNGIDDFDVLTALGQGSFGLVVSFQCKTCSFVGNPFF